MLPTHPGNGSLSNEYDAALLAAAGSINNTDGDDADDSVDAVLDRIAHDLSSAVEAILLFHDHLPPSEQDGGSSSSSGPPNGDSTRRFRDVTRPRSIRDAYHRNWKFAQRFDPTMAHGDRASYGYERDHLSEEDEESGLTSSSSTFSASLVPPLLSRSDGTSSTIATTTTSSSTSTNSSKKFAIFHALKNDYQVGGHVEEVIRLPTKADPIPSFLVNSSTATIPPTDTVELDSLDWLDDHLPLETGNPKNDDIAVSPSLPPIDSSSHPPTTPEALATTTATMEQGVVLPEKEPFADMFVVGHWNQPPLFNENLNNTALFTSDATSHHTIRSEDIANHHPVQPGSPPPLSPHVSSSDVVLETKDSSNDTNIIEEESRKLSLTNWFQSTFAVEPEGQSKHIDNVDDRNHNNDTHDARVLSQSEQARQDAVTRALVLLRTLNEGNWTDFDKPASLVASTTVPETAHPNLGAILEEETIAEIGGDESLIVDGAVDLTTSAPTADSEDSIAETFAGLSDLLHASRLGQAHLTTLDFNTLLARVAIATDLTPDECLSALMTTYRQMTDLANAGYECKPNAMTYEILLLSLTHRFSAFQSAVDLVVAMTASSSVSMWTPKTLEAIMMLCERKNLRRLAEKILSDLDRSNELSVIEIPKRAYLSMINILKTDDVRKPLSNVLQIALKVRHVEVVRLLHNEPLGDELTHLQLYHTLTAGQSMPGRKFGCRVCASHQMAHSESTPESDRQHISYWGHPQHSRTRKDLHCWLCSLETDRLVKLPRCKRERM